MPERSTPVPEGEGPDATDTDERMREAKRAIDEFVAGLDARAGVPPRGAAGAGPDPPAVPQPPPVGPPAGESFDEALDRRVRAEAAAIESRLSERIAERVRAAELRLGPQSEAPGTAAVADPGAEELEVVRAELRAAHGDALARIEQLRSELRAGSGAADAEAYVAQGRDRVLARVDAWVAERVEGALAQQLALLTTELRAEAVAAVQGAAGRAGAGLEARAAGLEAEVAELREDLSKRGIKRHRQRLDDDHEKLLTEARAGLKLEAEQLGTWLGSTARVAETGAESRIRTLIDEAGESLAKVRETLGDEFRRLAWETGEEFERRIEQRFTILERELLMTVEAAEVAAGQRLAEAVEDAGARLRAVDSAQERELRIRDRVQRAREQAERRVREAERRLADVLDGLEPTGH
jgi:hypothetical protein